MASQPDCRKDKLIAVKLREAEPNLSLKELREELPELSESRQRHLQLMEQEAQAHESMNQVHRQEALDAALVRERALQARQRECHHKYTDFESKAKYESIQDNLRNMAIAQRIAELETDVSEYKLKDEVMATEGELRNNNMDR